jgi:hypothetical protein
MDIGFWWESRKEATRKTQTGWESNIIMDLTELGWGGTDWIDLVKARDQ